MYSVGILDLELGIVQHNMLSVLTLDTPGRKLHHLEALEKELSLKGRLQMAAPCLIDYYCYV